MSTWTPERVELLKKLSAEGQAARAIALALGGGFTRNAVIGKLHRVSTDERSTTYGYGPHRRKPASERKAGEGQGRLGHGPQPGEVRRSEEGRTKPPPPLPPEPPVPSEAKMLSLMELSNRSCKWPIGDPAAEGFGFCGADKPAGQGAYCGYHAGLAYASAEAWDEANSYALEAE